MPWWGWALLAWPEVALAVALLLGAAIGHADDEAGDDA